MVVVVDGGGEEVESVVELIGWVNDDAKVGGHDEEERAD